MSVNFYKLMRCLQWGTHLGLAGGKRVKNKLTDILLMYEGKGAILKWGLGSTILFPVHPEVDKTEPGLEGVGCIATCMLTTPLEQPNCQDREPAMIPNFRWTGSLAGHLKKAMIPLIRSPQATPSAQGSLLAGSVECELWVQFHMEPSHF